MSGKDLIGIAKTGSGKTLAFLIPMYRHIMDQPPLDEEDGPIGNVELLNIQSNLPMWSPVLKCHFFCPVIEHFI